MLRIFQFKYSLLLLDQMIKTYKLLFTFNLKAFPSRKIYYLKKGIIMMQHDATDGKEKQHHYCSPLALFHTRPIFENNIL